MNLIITCARHMEPETAEEIGSILEDMGDPGPTTTITDMPGILTVQTTVDPFAVVRETREKLSEEPWHVRYCLRLIPVQKTAETSIEDIGRCVDGLRDGILEKDTYRISVEKRNSSISTQELISRIAGKIPNKVSLEIPDKIVLIEVLGDKTGVAIIQRGDILSVEKTKRSLSE